MIKSRVIKLLIVVAMLAVVAVTVNKSLFGLQLLPEKEVAATTEEVTPATADAVYIHTDGMDETVEGYAGPVPVGITIEQGRISEIEVLPNSETPSFLRRASVILDQWIGKTPAEAMAMHIDAVSGATYTSNALISNVNAGLTQYVGVESDSRPEVPLKLWIALVVTLAACVVPLFVRSRVYYNVQLIANVIVLGFWAGQFLDYYIILDVMSRGPVLPFALVIIVMLISAFIYPVFGKSQFYCTHVCPLGSAQILVGELCGYKIKISPKMLKGLDWFRKGLWAALMLTLVFDRWTEWMNWELFQAFQVEFAPTWILIAAGVFLLLSLVVSRPYCRFICPTGSIFKFIDQK